MEWMAWVAAAYLLGSIPSGVLVARAMGGRDPRSAGSGNIGATNVGRVLGKKAGLLTLFLDALKGFVPAFLAARYLPAPWHPCAVGFSSFAGHLFPLYLRFRGGKGIATGAGVMAAVSPLSLAAGLGLFALTLWRWRMVSLASVTASASLPVLAYFLTPPELTLPATLLSAALAVLTVYKHRENLARIRAGTESKLGQRA